MSDDADRSVAGDDDTWMLFDRTTDDGYPLVVLTRTGNPLVETSLHEAIITIVRCQADIPLVNDHGMPQHTDRLYPVEEAIARELDALDAGAMHIASVTGHGLRRIVFTHPSSLDFQPMLKHFSPEGYSLSASTAEDREDWITLVTPTEVERQLNGDIGVISNLEKNGDDGFASRKTDFWFYGATSALEKIVTDLGPWGYVVDHWLKDPEGVVLTTETPVDLETFREITPVLIATAERHGATYDGWETIVVRDASIAEPPTPPKPQSLLGRLFGAKKN